MLESIARNIATAIFIVCAMLVGSILPETGDEEIQPTSIEISASPQTAAPNMPQKNSRRKAPTATLAAESSSGTDSSTIPAETLS